MALENDIGIASFRNERHKASMSILFTYGLLSYKYENFFKGHGLTTQQYNGLRILAEQYPKPVSTSFLREKMLDKMSDASRLVSRLEAKGLVEVKQNAADKRLVNILISEEGMKVIDTLQNELYQLDALLQGLNEEEATTLVALLEKVRESLKTVDDPISTTEPIDA
jgi:MarR family transcriptional regulator, 2-MHQ and catechol-resistance regulon repressor